MGSLAAMPTQDPAMPNGAALANVPQEQQQQPELSAFQQLSPEAIMALEGALKSALKDNQTNRREEVRSAWKLRDYCRGKQHAVYDSRNFLYITLQASGEALPMHMGTYDITSPQKRTFVAILSEQAPGINFVPDELGKPNDNTAAKQAEKLRAEVDEQIEMKAKQAKAAGYFCTDSRVIAWVHVDRNQKLVVDIFGVLESKVPAYSQTREDWGYCVLSREVDKWRAKWDNPDFADKIDAADTAGGDSSYERYARLGVISKSRGGNTEVLKGITTEHYGWIAPWRYEKMQDGIKQEIEAAFPDGVVIHAFGSTAVDAFSVSDPLRAGELAVEFPVDGEGQVRPALLNALPDIQDAYNDLNNILRELAEYGIPATWVNTDGGVDLEAIANQRSAPGVIHGIAAGTRDLNQLILQEQASTISQQLLVLLDHYKQDAEYATGAYAQLQGDEVTGQDTVGVNKLLTNQAKGQLGPAWSAIQRLFAKIYVPAIRIRAMLDQSPVAVSGAGGQDTVDPQLILDGQFYCHPDQDSSFPETMADKRAAMQAVFSQLAQDPKGSEIIFHPDNLAMIRQYSGLKDLVIVEVVARDKMLQQIEQMLNEPPIPPSEEEMQQYQQAVQLAQQQGQQPPPPPSDQPSVAIDEDWDFHQPMVDKIKEWLSSAACSDAIRAGKDEGVRNVKLQGAQRMAVLAKQAQAAAPKPDVKVSLAVKTDDPVTTAAAAQAAGLATSPQAVAASQQPEVNKTVAQTNHANAQAIHVSELAARDRVKPHDVQQFVPKPDDAPGGVN